MADQQDKDQKTEEATPRRRSEARDKGQVAMSTEFVAAVALCVGVAMLAVGSGQLFESIGRLVVSTVEGLGPVATGEIDSIAATRILKGSLFSVLGTLSLVLAPAILVSAAAGYGQAGFKITPDAVQFDPSKLNVVKGLQRTFGMRGVVRTALAAAKVSLIGLVMGGIAWAHVEEVSRVSTAQLGPMLVAVTTVALRSAGGALLVILLLSLVDLFYQRWQHTKDLRMTKQEVKEEHKLSDGDPHVKARVRQLQREMAFSRMMDDVPDATVVVTNPTHYAVALRYERGEGASRAPICVAKGIDDMAQRIKQRAAEAGVPLHEDVPLARALHARVDLGDEIPEELFAAVATVLSQVYALEGAGA